MLTSNPGVPNLIAEKIRLKSRIQAVNRLLGEFRQIVKREVKKDSDKIADIEEMINKMSPRKKPKTFLFF